MNLLERIALASTELAEYGEATLELPHAASLYDVAEIVVDVGRMSGCEMVDAFRLTDGTLRFVEVNWWRRTLRRLMP